MDHRSHRVAAHTQDVIAHQSNRTASGDGTPDSSRGSAWAADLAEGGADQNDPAIRKGAPTAAAKRAKGRRTPATTNAGGQLVGAAATAAVSYGPEQPTRGIDLAQEQAHRSAIQTTFPDMAAYLQEVLGQRLTAHLADVADPQTVARWIKADRKPRTHAEVRIVAAYQIFQLMLSEEAPQTIRAWFLGLNPQLGDNAPAQAIRDGQFRQTMRAAKAFLASG